MRRGRRRGSRSRTRSRIRSTTRKPPRSRSSTSTAAPRASPWTGSEPDWSPAGTKLVYSAFGDLWTVRRDGTGAQRLARTQGFDIEPAWSRDGAKIAFVRGPAVWTMNADGTAQTRIGPGAEPAWGPTGPAFVRDGRAISGGRPITPASLGRYRPVLLRRRHEARVRRRLHRLRRAGHLRRGRRRLGPSAPDRQGLPDLRDSPQRDDQGHGRAGHHRSARGPRPGARGRGRRRHPCS